MLVGTLVIVASVVLAALAPALAPADPIRNDLLARLAPPMWMEGGSARHPLGTDTLGRDVVSRLLYGARVSLLVGFAAVLVAGVVGVALGLVAGYYGGRLDDLFMRVGDVQLAFPVLVLAIAVLSVLGASLGNVIIVLGLTGWVTYARITRAETLSLRAPRFRGGRPGARRAATPRSSGATSCPTCCRRSRWWRPSPWRGRSSPRRRCRSWDSASRRPRPAGARCWTKDGTT